MEAGSCLDRFSVTDARARALEENRGKRVMVQLKDGKRLRGKLKGFDEHLNLVLEETEESTNVEQARKLGAIILRGDNVVIISSLHR